MGTIQKCPRLVVDLRKDLYLIESAEIRKEKLRVAVNIAQLFGPRWTLTQKKTLPLYRKLEQISSQVRFSTLEA